MSSNLSTLNTPTALIVLAAGKGSRMKSDLPKTLHPVAGAPMLWHAMRAGGTLAPQKSVVVTGFGGDAVKASALAYDDKVEIALQREQLGTGHAVLQAKAALDGFDGDALVLYADTPFIQPETLQSMAAARKTHDIVVLGFDVYDPSARYGRLVTEGDDLLEIVEFKDATENQRAITLCNSGVVMADRATLMSVLEDVTNDNAAGEYYLTDIVSIARSRGLSATVVKCEEAETMGVNSRAELARAEAAYQTRMRDSLLDKGVTMQAPDTVHVAWDTEIAPRAEIEPYVVFAPGVSVASGAKIRAFSHLEGAHVASGAVVGPYARLRPGADLGENTRVGNFVEIKNATLDAGAKANHLTYVGDAHVGAKANLGAGTVTCNYDGFNKHKTEIGANAFIGSSTMLVAPVSVGDGAMTASGSVITKDVAPGDLALARAQQVNKPGLAKRLFEKLKKIKESKTKGTT